MITENLQKKIDRAIRLLQGIQKLYDGEIEIAYSGGKDSDVILQLAKESGIKYRAIYKNTTIDSPGTLGHVREMGVEILRARFPFFHLVAQKGFPSRYSRFCCEKLKEYKVLNKSIIGVRKAESWKRNERYNEPTKCRYYGAKKEENHVEQIYPILEWTDEDVRNFIIDRKLKLAPIYYNSGGANRRVETSRLHVLPSRLKAQAHYRVSEISQDSKGLSPCGATIYGNAS
jgi:phosphoadenosine phosphosulfate reductase